MLRRKWLGRLSRIHDKRIKRMLAELDEIDLRMAADQQRRADEIYPSARKGQPVSTITPKG